MATVKNQKGDTFDVSDVDAVNMIKADPSLSIVGDVATSGGGDAAVSVAGGQALTQEGVAPATAEEQHQFARKERHQGIGSSLKALGGGAVDSLTFGAVSPFEEDREFHGTLDTIGGIGGALLPGAFGGEAGFLRAAGLGGDALTAERAASSLSSPLLFAGKVGAEVGEGTKLERTVLRAGAALDDAKAAAGTATALPEELAGLDAKGLRAAHAAELENIEAGRVPQRASLASDLAEFRGDTKQDKLWLVTKGSEDAEVRSLGKRTLKADRQLDGLLDNPKRLAEKPELARAALQQQEAALESIAAKSDDLRKAFAGDTTGERAATLDKIPQALERNRALQERIAQLTAEPSSARLAAITDAREALSIPKPSAPPPGLPEQMLQGSVFHHVSSLVGGTVLGPFASAIAAKASKLVSDGVFGRLGEAAAKTGERTKEAVSAFLDVGKRAAPTLLPEATKVLSKLSYGPAAQSATASKATLASAFKARAAEIKAQTQYGPTGQPEMTAEARAAMASRLAPIRAHAPQFADAMETLAARRLEFLSSKLPRRPDLGGMPTGPDHWQPSDMEMRAFARYAAAVEDPGAIEERLRHGSVTPEDAEAYHAVYPERAAHLKQQIIEQLPKLQKQLPYERRLALSLFSGVPVDPATNPRVLAVLQGSFADEPGTQGGTSAPTANPQFGSVKKSVPSPTPAQDRSQGDLS